MSGRMQGKICLVTGATAGIGKATALGLARLDARVVIVGRDAGLTEETVNELRRESRNSQVESLVADLSSQSEVRRLAAAFQQRYDKLDVLINNAGVLLTRREMTVDGFERTWAVNCLAKVLLTLEGVTGKYFDKCNAVRSSNITYDEPLQEQLWRLSLRPLQLTDVGPAPAQIVATQ